MIGRVLGAQGVTGGGVLQAHNGDDVARGHGIDVDALIGMHLQKTADALLLVLRGVQHVAAGVQMPGVHAQVGELAHVGVGHDLEGQGRERGLRIGRTILFLAGLGVHALDRRDVHRGRHVVDHGVQQLLHALVLVGGAHEHGVDLAGDDALADGGLQLLDGDFLLHEDLLHEVVVAVGSGLQTAPGGTGLGVFGELGRDGVHGLRVGHALVVGLEVPRGHGHQVDDAPEVVLGAHGNLSGHGVGVQTVAHGLDGVEKVGAHAVVLVDEGDAGHAVALGLAPDRLGLGLHAGNGVEHGDGAVEHAQGALHLGREVHVAGGVDDLEAVLLAIGLTAGVLPKAGGGCSGDGHAALLLLDHPVHGGSAVVHLADLMSFARVVEDALGRGGLACIDVGHDADVARISQIDFSHVSSPAFRSGSARTHGSLRPSCTCPRASSQRRRCCWRRR